MSLVIEDNNEVVDTGARSRQGAYSCVPCKITFDNPTIAAMSMHHTSRGHTQALHEFEIKVAARRGCSLCKGFLTTPIPDYAVRYFDTWDHFESMHNRLGINDNHTMDWKERRGPNLYMRISSKAYQTAAWEGYLETMSEDDARARVRDHYPAFMWYLNEWLLRGRRRARNSHSFRRCYEILSRSSDLTIQS